MKEDLVRILDKTPLATELKEAIKSLAVSEERFRLLVSTVKDYSILLLDANGMISTWNAGAQRIKGYTAEEIIGRSIETFYTDEDKARRLPKALLERARVEGRVEDEGWRVRKDGSRFWANTVLTAILGEQGLVGFSKVTRDLTERKLAEEKLRRSVDDLAAVNKELEAFSYSVAHDLRAPLRAIDGFSRLFVEDYGGVVDVEGRRLLDVVRSNTQRMSKLIDDLLGFSRLGRQELHKAAVDMQTVAGSALEDLRNAGIVGGEFTMGRLPRADGDAGLLREVFTNLFTNAVKYSSKNPGSRVEVGASDAGLQTVYFVRDNGAGFDMKYANKLFGVFQRLHSREDFEGTGVGLAIVDRIVRKHGGQVWAESEVGKGATFSFSLPKEKNHD